MLKMLVRGFTLFMLVGAVGCATASAPTALVVSDTPPPPVAGGVPHFYCVFRQYPEQQVARKGRSCGYVVSIRGFDKPLFSDLTRRDVSTAHFT